MDFTLKVLKADQENQVFSPINVAHALGLFHHGSSTELDDGTSGAEKEIANIPGYGKYRYTSTVFNPSNILSKIFSIN